MERFKKASRQKPFVDNQTKFEQQIIDYMKKAVLSSKIILDEDFDVLIDAPILFPAIVTKSYRFHINLLLSTAGICTVKAVNRLNLQSQYMAVALIPLGYEIFDLFKRCIEKRYMHKQIDNFVDLLERHATLNHKVVKHLLSRIKLIQDLECKINSTVIKIIQEDDQKFANFAAEILASTCRLIQQQLIIQASYSESRYSCVGNWQLESCQQDSCLMDATNYIERTSELYILLASTFMSSTIRALEEAMWRSHADFEVVFQTVREIMKTISHSMSCIEKQMAKAFSEFDNVKCPPAKPKPNEQKSIYTDNMQDCKYRLKFCYDIAKTIENQNSKTRYVLLEEMLDNFDHGSTIIRNLLKYEQSKGISKPIPVLNNLNVVEKIQEMNLERNSENEIVESDDELYSYSPNDTDNEVVEYNDRAHGDFDEDEKTAAVVQNLMLLELKNRMKDVRRIKIIKTPSGDLIVKERPITLEESGGELEAQVIQSSITDFKACKAKPSLTCIQQSLKVNRISAKFSSTSPSIAEEDEPPNVPLIPDNKFLESISALANKRHRREEVFDYVGEDYVGSDTSTDDDK